MQPINRPIPFALAKEWVRMYEEDNMSSVEIAATDNRHYSTVTRVLRRCGVKMRPAGSVKGKAKPRRLT